MTLHLSSLPPEELRSALEQCGLTAAAADVVLALGPFQDDAALCDAVDTVLTTTLDEAELRRVLEAVPEPEVAAGDPDAHEAALLAMRLYRQRFGYAFVSGIATETSEELLMRVRIRLGNDPAPEGRAAREHMRRLVRKRIHSLQEGSSAG